MDANISLLKVGWGLVLAGEKAAVERTVQSGVESEDTIFSKS
jgi:hypothetical protein